MNKDFKLIIEIININNEDIIKTSATSLEEIGVNDPTYNEA